MTSPTSTSTSSTQVDVDLRDGVAVITLNGPATRNALDRGSAQALVDACDAVDADSTVGAAIFRGANGAFCSGATRDVLRRLATATPDQAYEELSFVYEAFTRVGHLRVPTLAAIEGAAVGAGLNLALATDVRIASDQAKFISGFAPAAIHPGGGHLHLVNRSAGQQAAAAMGIFARPLTANQALAVGMVWDVVSSHELDATVREYTRFLAADPVLARALKTTLELTVRSTSVWAAAVEVERARQMWSLTR